MLHFSRRNSIANVHVTCSKQLMVMLIGEFVVMGGQRIRPFPLFLLRIKYLARTGIIESRVGGKL